MTKPKNVSSVPAWFSFFPALKEVQKMVELSTAFTVCLSRSNEILAAEIDLCGGDSKRLPIPLTGSPTGRWHEDLLLEQESLLTIFIYRNKLMSILVETIGGSASDICISGSDDLPEEMLPRLIAIMCQIGIQMQTYNQLENRRLEVLRRSR